MATTKKYRPPLKPGKTKTTPAPKGLPNTGGSKTKPNKPPGGSKPGFVKGSPKTKAQKLATAAKTSRGEMAWSDWIKRRQSIVSAMRSRGNSAAEKKLIKSTAKDMGEGGASWSKRATKASVKGVGKPAKVKSGKAGVKKPGNKYKGPQLGGRPKPPGGRPISPKPTARRKKK